MHYEQLNTMGVVCALREGDSGKGCMDEHGMTYIYNGFNGSFSITIMMMSSNTCKKIGALFVNKDFSVKSRTN